MDVLVVEDNEMDLELTSTYIMAAGMTVHQESNPNDALIKLQNGLLRPDIIILDWMMPGMDGLQLCLSIRELNIDVDIDPYIFLVTSNTWSDAEEQALDIGADDFIEKPIHGKKFIARLKVAARLVTSQKRLLELAHTDPLTKLANRAAGLLSLNEHLSRLFREKEYLEHTLILADIDFFKSINDQYGHLVGDRVLIEVANRLKSCVRPFETVARLGGEEFLIYCEASKHNVQIIISRILNSIANPPIEYDHNLHINVTISLGCVVVRNDGNTIQTDTLIGMADKLLYKTKDNGRNGFQLEYASDVD